MSTPIPSWRSKLKPFVPVYAAAIALKEWLLDHNWLKQRRLAHPVISIGSLSAGGAGKTPLVMLIAELLATRGYEVRILTRGYGRTGTTPERVPANGDPHRFGDEPLMMANHLPNASVWVGPDRYRTGTLSEEHDQPETKILYLLDDGFQHRQLIRNIDIVLLTREDLVDTLLPAGNLREPLKAMRRADIVVLREEEGFAGSISGKASTWFVRRSLTLPTPPGNPETQPTRTIAFCGLARPEGFFAMLAEVGNPETGVKNAGIEVAAVSIFPDHHSYNDADITALIDLAKSNAAEAFVTTEKDAVKLTPAMRLRLGRLLIPRLTLTLAQPDACLNQLLHLLAP